MSVRAGFIGTTAIGVLWAFYGIFQPTSVEFVVGTVIAAVGVIGFDVVERL